MSQSVTITDSFEVYIPDGYEYVRYGIPKYGELYISTGYDVVKATCDDRKYEREEIKRVIIEKVADYVWPDFIKSGTWMAMDKDGTWNLYYGQPYVNDLYWFASSFYDVNKLNEIMNIPVPKCSDWTKSLIQKP